MNNVIQFINDLNIDGKVVLACSYGPDSMCLLDILKKMKIDIVVATVNHKLREESDEEYRLLKKYCDDNNLIFEGYEIKEFPKGNMEAIARSIRYKFLDEVVNKYRAKYLFTAHHGDDLVETVLMKINRGASLKGYSGISFISSFNGYNLVRPLLYLTKEEILKYNEDNGILYAVDQTNFELDHTRNIFRHKVLPVLKEINPQIHKKFINFSDNILNYYNYVNEEVNSYKSLYYNNGRLDINEINLLPLFIKKLLVQSILQDIYKDNIDKINSKHIELIIKLFDSTKANSVINLPMNINVYKFYNIIEIKEEIYVNDYDCVLSDKIKLNEFQIYLVDKSDIIKSNYLIRLDKRDVALPLHIRNRKVGDKIQLKNGTKSVGEVLSEAKISFLQRDEYPILTDDDGKILWIPGVKKSKYDRNINDSYDIIVKCKKEGEKNEEKKY